MNEGLGRACLTLMKRCFKVEVSPKICGKCVIGQSLMKCLVVGQEDDPCPCLYVNTCGEWRNKRLGEFVG